MKPKHYYNEFHPFVAQWLRNLIAAGHIPDGDVDERSIVDVTPADLAGYRQSHFFCGVAGWPLALKFAGWSADREIWTGSCPCQPFSAAGEGKGFEDDRHLWPHFERLIEKCRPAVVVGEQVASKAVDVWIDLVLTDLEALGYASAAVAFPSASVGAPHIRDRTFWLGHANNKGLEGLRDGHSGTQGQRQAEVRSTAEAGGVMRLADSKSGGRRQEPENVRRGDARSEAQGVSTGRTSSSSTDVRLANAHSDGCDAWITGNCRCEEGTRREHGNVDDRRSVGACERPGPVNGFWRAADWLAGRDGKWRPVEPGTFPLAHGVPGRVEQLRAYGNAINPYQAAEFLKAYMDCRP